MSPGPGPRSSQWSALQPRSVNLLLLVWPVQCEWLMLSDPGCGHRWPIVPGESSWPGATLETAPGQEGGGHTGSEGWVRHYWNTEWMWRAPGQQTSDTVPVIPQSCAPSLARSPGTSPLLSLNTGPKAMSTLSPGSGQCLRPGRVPPTFHPSCPHIVQVS